MATYKVSAIIFDIEADSKEEALEIIADKMYQATGTDNVPDAFIFEVEEVKA